MNGSNIYLFIFQLNKNLNQPHLNISCQKSDAPNPVPPLLSSHHTNTHVYVITI